MSDASITFPNYFVNRSSVDDTPSFASIRSGIRHYYGSDPDDDGIGSKARPSPRGCVRSAVDP